MPESDLLLAGAPARSELTHNSHVDESYAPEEPYAPWRPHRKSKPKRAAAHTRSSAEQILSSFNSWSFKREQPESAQLMLQCIARAVALAEPLSFVLYWGKGPRSSVAAPDTQCLDFINSLASRVASTHAPGASVTLILTDTHAKLNGHSHSSMERYFADIDVAARQRGFSTCRLSELVADHHCGAIRERDCHSPESGTLAALTASARKWYRGPGTPEQGARTYYLMNMREKRAVERAFPDSIFITFNGSTLRALFPDHLPIFYMYSLRRGTSVKPWFLPDETVASARAIPA